MSGDASNDQNKLIATAMQDPKMLAALQEKLQTIEGMRSNFFETLPKPIKDRVYACRNIQKDFIRLETDFYDQVNKLEKEYHEKYLATYNKRKDIIMGDYDPTPEECEHSDSEDEENDDPEKMDTEAEPKPSVFPEDSKGIPEFWLSVLKSAAATDGLIEEHDEPVMKHLEDLTLTFLDEQELNSEEGVIGFRLNFHFSENQWFDNKVLDKTYKLRIIPEEGAVLQYEGPEIISSEGTTIQWKNDIVDVTKKTINKKQRNKKTGATRTIQKLVQTESFFNYFSSVKERLELIKSLQEGEEIEDDDDEYSQEAAMLEADYEIGHFIRERIIPRAVLYYTGEVDDDDEDEDYDDEEASDEVDESGEEDPDFDPSKAAKQPECKQQ